MYWSANSINSINQQVHTELPYSNHGPPQTSNEEDGIYTGPSTDGLMQSNSGVGICDCTSVGLNRLQ